MSNKPFSLVEEKLAEAEFFIGKMTSAGANVFELRCYFSAFVSAARSISFSLQAVMKHVAGFEEWYSNKQKELRQNPLARFFIGRRNEILKVGDTRINAGEMYHDENRRVVVRHYFSKTGPLDTFESIETDVVSASQEYLKLLQELVSECCSYFATEIDPDAFYTMNGLKSRDLSIEDVEEMLGFPRGWTQGIPDEERLRGLKESTPPISVEWFLREHIQPQE